MANFSKLVPAVLMTNCIHGQLLKVSAKSMLFPPGQKEIRQKPFETKIGVVFGEEAELQPRGTPNKDGMWVAYPGICSVVCGM
jgi:hypothetical protein